MGGNTTHDLANCITPKAVAVHAEEFGVLDTVADVSQSHAADGTRYSRVEQDSVAVQRFPVAAGSDRPVQAWAGVVWNWPVIVAALPDVQPPVQEALDIILKRLPPDEPSLDKGILDEPVRVGVVWATANVPPPFASMLANMTREGLVIG